MFDWGAELKTAKRAVAAAEEGVRAQRLALQRAFESGADTTSPARILSIREKALERARTHERFVAHRISLNLPPPKPAPYLELSHACFETAKRMPDSEARRQLIAQGQAFYEKTRRQ
jgi:hypothetical protein